MAARLVERRSRPPRVEPDARARRGARRGRSRSRGHPGRGGPRRRGRDHDAHRPAGARGGAVRIATAPLRRSPGPRRSSTCRRWARPRSRRSRAARPGGGPRRPGARQRPVGRDRQPRDPRRGRPGGVRPPRRPPVDPRHADLRRTDGVGACAEARQQRASDRDPGDLRRAARAHRPRGSGDRRRPARRAAAGPARLASSNGGGERLKGEDQTVRTSASRSRGRTSRSCSTRRSATAST